LQYIKNRSFKQTLDSQYRTVHFPPLVSVASEVLPVPRLFGRSNAGAFWSFSGTGSPAFSNAQAGVVEAAAIMLDDAVTAATPRKKALLVDCCGADGDRAEVTAATANNTRHWADRNFTIVVSIFDFEKDTQ
jgi:hypothetical protein